MSIVTIILFFLYMYGFGVSAFSVLKLKESTDAVEKHVMRAGIGIGIYIVIAVFLNMVNIPLYWWLFLLLAWIIPVYDKIQKNQREKASFNFTLTKKNMIYLSLLILFIFNLFMYTSGSFAYEYLENDDPWTHAREMKYVSIEKTLDVDYFRPINYLDPYPPGYASIMGVLHQTSPDAQWTLKFFNSLLISFSILVFFFMVRSLSRSSAVALASTFILSMLPSYLSHFIWSHTLIPMLFMLLVYTYMKIDHDKKWWIISSLVTASIFLTHTRQIIKLMIMAGLFFIVIWAYRKKFPVKIFWSAIVGFIISLMWWIFNFKDLLKMLTHATVGSGPAGSAVASGNLFTKILSRIPSMFSPTGGTATRAYSVNDFFIAQKTNMINSPIGWGIVVSLLLLFAIIIILKQYKKLRQQRNMWLTAVLVWFVFTFLFVNSETFNLPIGFGAFRIWMLLAIPVSILAGYGMLLAANMVKKVKYPILILLIILVFFTSGIQKYDHNTNPNWPAGGKWTSGDELGGYVWMKNNIPMNSNVFTYSVQNKVVYGLNMNACVWCESYREFHPTVLDQNLDTVYSWLKQEQYEYIVFGGMEVKYLGRTYGEEVVLERIGQLVGEMGQQPARFQLVHQQNGFILFKIL